MQNPTGLAFSLSAARAGTSARRASGGVALILFLMVAWLSPAAQAAEPLRVGRSLALTGPLASYGNAKRDGHDAYIELINKSGGVNGRAIELTTLDDVYDGKNTIANLRKIATEQRPTAWLGLFGVPTVAAALPVIEELRIPAVGLTSGSPALRTPNKRYVFPVRASYADEAAYIVRHIKTLSFARVAVIHQDNAFGELARDTLVKAFAEADIKISVDVKIAANGSDAEAAVEAAAASKPEAIFLAMLSGPAAPTMLAIKKRGLAGMALYTFSTVDASVLTKALGKDASGLGISQIVPLPTSIQSKVAKEYMAALTALGRGTPSFYGLEAFIEAKVLVTAMRKAGKDAADPEALTRALESLGEYDAGGYIVNYNRDAHRGGRFVELTVIGSRGTIIR
jgi:branched-chain amino acid transport system substrate-binding protein